MLHCMTYIHYITLPYNTLHGITFFYTHTLHSITLHYIRLHYITLHYITLHAYIQYTLHYLTVLYITLHYRSRLAEEARAAGGMSNFAVTGSLRASWEEAQSKDPSLAESLQKTLKDTRELQTGCWRKKPVCQAERCPQCQSCQTASPLRGGRHAISSFTAECSSPSGWLRRMPSHETCGLVGHDEGRHQLPCFKARCRATKVTTKLMKPTADYCWQEVKERVPKKRTTQGVGDCLLHAVYLDAPRPQRHADLGAVAQRT